MVEPLFDCPSIGDILLKESKSDIQKGFLQNLPSVLCGHALQVKSWHTVLGMYDVLNLYWRFYSMIVINKN